MSKLHLLFIAVFCALSGWLLSSHCSRQHQRTAPVGWKMLQPTSPLVTESAGIDWTLQSPRVLDSTQSMRSLTQQNQWEVQLELQPFGRAEIYPGKESKPQLPGFQPSQKEQQNRMVLRHLKDQIEVSTVRSEQQGPQSLRCAPEKATLPPEPITITVNTTQRGFTAQVGDTEIQCQARLSGNTPEIRAGLLPVAVKMAADPEPWNGAFFLLGVALVAIIVGVEQLINSNAWVIVTGFLPMLLIPWLLGESESGFADALRIEQELAFMAPLVLVWALTALLKLLIHSFRFSLPTSTQLRWLAPGLALLTVLCMPTWPLRAIATAMGAVMLLAPRLVGTITRDCPPEEHSNKRVAVALLLPVTGVAAAVAFTGAQSPWLVSAMIGAAAAIGMLLWVNANPRHRFVNISSLLCLALALGWAEYGARFSEYLWRWLPAQSERAMMDSFTALTTDASQHHDQRIELRPTLTTRNGNQTSIACFGGSSTAGSFGQSNELYYPSLLSRSHPEYSVNNLGLAGWTSFHLSKYIAHNSNIDHDYWTIYLGYNEHHFRSNAPLEELYANWQQGGQSISWLSHSKLLYAAARFISLGLLGGDSASVPPQDFENNLQQLSSLAQQRGARLILIPEGYFPETGVLSQYAEAMRSVAAQPHVSYLDVQPALTELGDSGFIDGNHLSLAGHRVVSQLLSEHLRTLEQQ